MTTATGALPRDGVGFGDCAVPGERRRGGWRVTPTLRRAIRL